MDGAYDKGDPQDALSEGWLKRGLASARHSHKSVEWYTPSWLVEKARLVLGEIWLDPCSSEEAQKTVDAREFWTAHGLDRAWQADTIFLNPPGRSPENPLGVAPWWDKLVCAASGNWTRAGIYVGFSLEQLQVLQNQTGVCPLMYTTCIPKKRIAYVSPDGAKKSPTHGSFVTLVTTRREIEEYFAQEFAEVGYVRRI